ncbi:nuclear transport factor 2 family protein [Pedobacter sp. Leaf170]|uniref:nuclear transport factor 2 family protein n=1 Tax=Pedobacter sp. Leaf170 TaxID=2876558 RepID=UPI001E51AB42|nr:nuclear transport factor 2 family protein [Pedobacter sp. Leaf170]
MKKVTFLTLFIIFSANVLWAQSDDEQAIKQTINNLFLGMKNGDSSLAASAFAKESILQTIVSKEGKNTIKTESVLGFLKMIAIPRTQIYDERIVFSKILIDGALAAVWTEYKFYIDERFSHCGVNSFQLVKGEKGWQIAYLIDTRRKDNCKP